MVNYNKALIYKIVPKDLDRKYCYIGSTCNFIKRKSQHKENCNPNSKKSSLPIYQHIIKNGGWEEFEMFLVEYYPCETKLELHKRERECKEIYNDNLGCKVPTRTRKEYYQDNKEKITEQNKQYREDNKEKITEKRAIHYQVNKEKIAEQWTIHYQANKAKIAETKKEKKNVLSVNVISAKVIFQDIQNQKNIYLIYLFPFNLIFFYITIL